MSKICPCSLQKSGNCIWIQCNDLKCQQWWHASCAGFEKPKNSALNAIGAWKCPMCVMASIPTCSSRDAQKKFETVIEEQESWSKREEKNRNEFYERVSRQLEDFKKEIKKGMGLAENSYKKALIGDNNVQKVKQNKIEVEKVQSEQKEKHRVQEDQLESLDEEEMQLRERKKMNVCLFNLPESDSTDSSISYKEDMLKLKKVLFSQDGFDPKHVKRAYRVGQISNERIRPMVIQFTDEVTRLNVLKMNQLQYNNSTKNVPVFTGINKTKKQVLLYKKLVKELTLRRDNGEVDLVIRNDRIVKKHPFRPSPQSIWG